jgi:hypothetical protein
MVAFAAISCLAWGLPATAQASPPPSVFDESVSHITEHDATLEATINPNGLKTTYQFRLESGCLPPLACLAIATYPLPSGEIAASIEAHPVSLDLNSAGVTLSPNTEYRYSIEATSSAGTNESPGHLFTTAPAGTASIEGESASNITPTDATLEAKINPEGLETTYEVWVGALPCVVEEGPEACEEDKVAGTIPAGFSAQQVSVDVAKASHQLKPDSAYLYSFRATNMDGTTYASNKEFKTGAASPPSIESESLSHLTSTDATLEARINAEGLETTYEFHLVGAYCEWPCESPEYLFTLPSGKLLGSFVGQSVSLDLNSADVRLMPVNTYWVTATNAAGTTVGSSHTFRSGEEGVQPLSTTTSTSSGAGQPAGINTNTGNQPAGSGGSPAPGVTPLGPQIVCLCNCTRGCHGKKVGPNHLTQTQKLSKALKACDKKSKKQRPSCKRQAEEKYAATSKHRA